MDYASLTLGLWGPLGSWGQLFCPPLFLLLGMVSILCELIPELKQDVGSTLEQADYVRQMISFVLIDIRLDPVLSAVNDDWTQSVQHPRHPMIMLAMVVLHQLFAQLAALLKSMTAQACRF